ncbi:GIY-YIG catalytic domain-containing endonuclease [Acanthocystis turfacea Chlorella virus NE-JV-3]|nr:GIY-YIG catalytic domain-containing endonuclease [Acanthocystis turfacea Chlorella virus NE-JV-3]
MKIIEERHGSIYKITFPNGKVYIGQTKRSLAQRGSEHIKDTSGCIKLKNAFKKYGHEECVMSVLKDKIPEQFLDYWENKFIDEYDSISSGYNIKYNVDFATPTDIGMTYIPPEPKVNPFAKFANKEYTPPRQKIQALLPKVPKSIRGNAVVMVR